MVKKCIWTGKSSEDLIEFQFQDVNGVMIYSVDAKHLEEFKTFLRFYLKYKKIPIIKFLLICIEKITIKKTRPFSLQCITLLFSIKNKKNKERK